MHRALLVKGHVPDDSGIEIVFSKRDLLTRIDSAMFETHRFIRTFPGKVAELVKEDLDIIAPSGNVSARRINSLVVELLEYLGCPEVAEKYREHWAYKED